jgi:hypothetical protein
MNRHARAFKITVWIGIFVNLGCAVAAVFAPDWFLTTLGFDVAYPNLWPRFAGWLLILLSLFYIPGANDLNRYRANAWLSVVARVSGVVFFTAAVVIVDFSARYLLFGLIDLVFAIPSGVFLMLAIRRQRQDQATARPPESRPRKEVQHAMAATHAS